MVHLVVMARHRLKPLPLLLVRRLAHFNPPVPTAVVVEELAAIQPVMACLAVRVEAMLHPVAMVVAHLDALTLAVALVECLPVKVMDQVSAVVVVTLPAQVVEMVQELAMGLVTLEMGLVTLEWAMITVLDMQVWVPSLLACSTGNPKSNGL